jgi:hypothetical protein
MIRILLIGSRLNGRRFHFVTKRTTLGLNKDCDIIVNNPALIMNSYRLAKGRLQPCESTQNMEAKDGFLEPKEIGITVLPGKKTFLAFGLLTFLTMAAAGISLSRSVDLITAQDWTPISLPAKGVYGNCRQDRTHAEGAIFRTTGAIASGTNLVMTPGSNGKLQYLEVYSGDSLIGVTPLPKGWGKRVSIPLLSDLPLGTLIKVQPSEPTSEMWAIKDLELSRSNSTSPSTIMDQKNLEHLRENLTAQRLSKFQVVKHYEHLLKQEKAGGDHSLLTTIKEVKYQLISSMETVLTEDLVKLRFLLASGEEERAKALEEEIRSWMPEYWSEGWVKFHEILNR